MKASKIVHRNQNRIKVDFTFNEAIAAKIKDLPDAQWSSTEKSWHIPYTKSAFDQLKKMFPAIEYKEQDTALHSTSHAETSKSNPAVASQTPGDVNIQVSGRSISIKLPKHELDTKFLLSFRYSRWDRKQFCWIIPNYPGNLELLKEFFKKRINKIVISEDLKVGGGGSEQRSIGKNDLLIIKCRQGRLKLYFSFNKELTHAVKKMPYNNWNSLNKYWSIPFTEFFLAEINSIAERQHLQLIYEEENSGQKKAFTRSFSDRANHRKCPEEYLLKLKELRYSKSTLKTYKASFEDFINYYRESSLADISETMIVDFLRHLVIERKTSVSYQNQAINAIKFYYERVLDQPRRIYQVERPINEKTLPVVLSVEEISALFKATENLKHKAILMLCYAAGLRVSELVNVRLKDIDSKRMQVRIEQSKGKKDRYSLLSNRLLEVLRAYFRLHRPKEWLFEGIHGEQYSVRSIQAIMKDSAGKAGIKKKVSVHTLRHSFATHLLEQGTDLRYIQTLLGHESSKTTEIYTHITTKGFDQIISPLDKLNL